MHKRIGVIMYQTSTSKGQELVAQRMVRDFIALGHQAYLITSLYHDGAEVIQARSLREKEGYLCAQDSGLGIPVIRVDSYRARSPSSHTPRRKVVFRDFVQVLGRIVDAYRLNVLITHSTLWNGPEEVAKFVDWRRNMRNLGGYNDPIVFCHMSHFQEPSPSLYSLFERAFRMAWNKFSLSQIQRTANLVLVVTPLEKDIEVKMGADPKKCLLFPSGVNEELFVQHASADIEKFLEMRRIPKGVKLVSYLGTIEKRKNPLAVLKVAELLKDRGDIHFIIAGRGGSKYSKRIMDKSSQMHNVSYLGEIDDKEKVLLIKSSYVNILLSKLEALGLAQLEFMYCGIPVVTSAVGGQSWLIRNGKEGVHTAGPHDVEGAAKAIVNLVDDQEAWKKLSLKAREKASNLAASRKMAELDEALTKEIIKESGLDRIPQEARETIVEPETVLEAWSAGSWCAVATERRLYIRHGRLSRRVIEIPYGNISYIEHTRRCPWNTFVAGFLPAAILLIILLARSQLSSILESTFISRVEGFTQSIVSDLQLGSPQNLIVLLATIPMLIGLGAFIFLARTGFNLHGSYAKPVYLPHRLNGVISFIRNIQDKQISPEVQMRKMRREVAEA